ncbi:Cro/CI family transcriptional regulator [Hafnia alvei]|uniref:Cro/CI family transcriptional regulator n=1 Tax=Hafnia alvei TaxID=569 RepID=UPI002DBC431F|nr:Cro/CI family transcriptional regulator [Hafnia alvei]MEB7891001.1 Cro/CI family transcriptional regulator [Hafnia alvei]
MEKLSLSEFVSRNSQDKVAKVFGVHQSAICKAIADERQITVTIHDNGKIEAIEQKPFPNKKIKDFAA